MARGPCTFKQQDLTRALRAAVAAGMAVQRIEIDPDGKITVVTGKATGDVSTMDTSTDLDKWKAKHARHA